MHCETAKHIIVFLKNKRSMLWFNNNNILTFWGKF